MCVLPHPSNYMTEDLSHSWARILKNCLGAVLFSNKGFIGIEFGKPYFCVLFCPLGGLGWGGATAFK